jgi:hypothetical protein
MMGTLSEHHKVLNEFGEGKCSVPMWCGGGPADFCDKPAYGDPPPGKTIRRWDGHLYREDGLYAGYVPALACPMHGGPKVRTFMDGNAWCAVGPDFVDLQASHAGFGATREEAIAVFNSPSSGKPE